MTEQTELAGSLTLPGTSITVGRLGYGAMQLAGPEAYGPPRDVIFIAGSASQPSLVPRETESSGSATATR
jgi:hypothetical protein